MKFLFANDNSSPKLNRVFCKFAAHIIWGRNNDFGPCGSMGIFKGSELIAAIIFHGWQQEYGVIEISAAAKSPAWLTRKSIQEIMMICFDQHNCQQIVSRMSTDNERAIKIYKYLGFDSVLLPNMRGSGKHEWLMLLQRDQWNAHKLRKAP